MRQSQAITIKSDEQLRAIRAAGQLAARMLDLLEPHIQPGISTGQLEERSRELLEQAQARSGLLGYNGYPAAICISVNDGLCNGLPSANKKLKSGDILSVEIVVEKDGCFGAASRMFQLGQVAASAAQFCADVRAALWAGIHAVRPGATAGDVGYAIQRHAEAAGLSVVREFAGHGIGTAAHEEPMMMNVGRPGQGLPLQAGMVIALQPILATGQRKIRMHDDGWSVSTADRSLGGNWKHMLAVTDTGCEVLTLGHGEIAPPPAAQPAPPPAGLLAKLRRLVVPG